MTFLRWGNEYLRRAIVRNCTQILPQINFKTEQNYMLIPGSTLQVRFFWWAVNSRVAAGFPSDTGKRLVSERSVRFSIRRTRDGSTSTLSCRSVKELSLNLGSTASSHVRNSELYIVADGSFKGCWAIQSSASKSGELAAILFLKMWWRGYGSFPCAFNYPT